MISETFFLYKLASAPKEDCIKITLLFALLLPISLSGLKWHYKRYFSRRSLMFKFRNYCDHFFQISYVFFLSLQVEVK